MRRAQHHVIRRQVLEIAVSGAESDGLALHRRLPDICQDWLLPSLEAVLERLVPGDEHWTIDRLDIDAGTLRPDAFEKGLVDAVTQEVERFLREHAARMGSVSPMKAAELDSADGPVARRSEEQSLQRAFLHFLQTGVLPWWFHLSQGVTLEEVIRASWRAGSHEGKPRDFLVGLRAGIATPTVRTRLVRQFSPDFLNTLLAGNTPECASAVRDIVTELTAFGIVAHGLERLVEHVWRTAFLIEAGERPSAEMLMVETLKSMPPGADSPRALPLRFATLLSDNDRDRSGETTGTLAREPQVLRQPATRPPQMRAIRDEGMPRLDLEEGVYVNCAGIVLLHPFVPRLFEAVDIARDGALLESERALSLLHFLATGQRLAPEYDLTLAKILCNIPLESPVASRIDLTGTEEDEAAALLAAVIRHWDALGETSAEALRNTFLMRAGKLSRRGGDDVLQVERLSFDILLDQLPWGVGMIQLPWMKRMLRVEWRF